MRNKRRFPSICPSLFCYTCVERKFFSRRKAGLPWKLLDSSPLQYSWYIMYTNLEWLRTKLLKCYLPEIAIRKWIRKKVNKPWQSWLLIHHTFTCGRGSKIGICLVQFLRVPRTLTVVGPRILSIFDPRTRLISNTAADQSKGWASSASVGSNIFSSCFQGIFPKCPDLRADSLIAYQV